MARERAVKPNLLPRDKKARKTVEERFPETFIISDREIRYADYIGMGLGKTSARRLVEGSFGPWGDDEW